MKSPFVKIAAAAVIIIGILLLFLYATNSQSSQNNEDTNIVRKDTDDKQIETANTNRQDDELLIAKQLFENKDIAGLSELLNSDFETVKIQVAEYLGQIGDETVLSKLQLLADKWNGLAQENVYKDAISAIEERLSEFEPEQEEPPQVTREDIEPNEPQIPQFKINTGVSGIVIDRDTLEPIQGAFIGFIDYKKKGTTTDANGCFTFTDPIFLLFDEGDSEEIPFLVMAPTYASQEMRVRMKKGEIADVTVKLSPGSKITGIVLDPNNQPVSNAEVSVTGNSRASFPVMTESDGKFEIDGVDPLYSYPRINVSHSLYQSVDIEFEAAPAGQSVYKEIILKAGVIVFGKVTDPNNKPINKATVGNTMTNEEGMYVLDNVNVNFFTLWVSHPDFAPFVQKIDIDPNQSQKQIDITLSDSYTLKGRVLDEQNNPVPNVIIEMSEYNGVYNFVHELYPSNRLYTSNQDGTFIIPGAPGDGELNLMVGGQGITSFMYTVDFDKEEQIIIAKRSGRIYGEVLDAFTGEPVQRFTVKMTFTQTGVQGGGYRSSWSEVGHKFNSADGYFDSGTDNLTLDSQYRIKIIAEGYDQLIDDLVPVQEISNNPERTQFLLEPSKLRIGKIITVDNQPIENASLVFYPNENFTEKDTLPGTNTNKEGIYSIFGPGSEYHIIEVNAPGYTPKILLQEDIIQSDERFKDIVLDHGESLSGYVYDDKGNGIANVTISASIDPVRVNNIRTPLANVRYTATTDTDGFYQLSGIPSGKLLIHVSNEAFYQLKKIEITPGNAVELSFGDEKGYMISGIFKAGQQELDNTRVFMFSSEGEFLRRVIADSRGRFKFYFIEEGSYDFKATWNPGISDNPENWPEGTNFTIERNLKLEQNMELDIDMQADTVTNVHTGQIIKKSE